MDVAIPRSASIIADAVVFYSRFIIKSLSLPKKDSSIEEINALRRFADKMKLNDPNMAKDLYAAADRHELKMMDK